MRKIWNIIKRDLYVANMKLFVVKNIFFTEKNYFEKKSVRFFSTFLKMSKKPLIKFDIFQNFHEKKIKRIFLGEKKYLLTGFFLTSRACSLLLDAPKG